MDVDLRELERSARTDPARALDLARALDRAGRPKAAEAALRHGVADPGVRAVLSTRWPSWAPGGPGRTGWLDVPALAQEPEPRWAHADPFPPLDPLVGAETARSSSELCRAGPAGVVLWRAEDGLLRVLDLVTGEPRWELEPGPRELHPDSLQGGALIVLEPRLLRALDAWSGQPRWAVDRFAPRGRLASYSLLDGSVHETELGPALTPRSSRAGMCAAGARWVSFGAPATARLQLAELRGWGGLVQLQYEAGSLTRRRVLAPATLVLLREETGATLMGDAAGLVVEDDRAAFRVLDPDGGALWHKDDPGLRPVLLGPSLVLCRVSGVPDHWRAFERSSGRVLRELTERIGLLAGAGDQLYLARQGELLALDLEGRRRWRLPLADLGPVPRDPRARLHAELVTDLVPIPWGLIVRRGDGLVACLAERE